MENKRKCFTPMERLRDNFLIFEAYIGVNRLLWDREDFNNISGTTTNSIIRNDFGIKDNIDFLRVYTSKDGNQIGFGFKYQNRKKLQIKVYNLKKGPFYSEVSFDSVEDFRSALKKVTKSIKAIYKVNGSEIQPGLAYNIMMEMFGLSSKRDTEIYETEISAIINEFEKELKKINETTKKINKSSKEYNESLKVAKQILEKDEEEYQRKLAEFEKARKEFNDFQFRFKNKKQLILKQEGVIDLENIIRLTKMRRDEDIKSIKSKIQRVLRKYPMGIKKNIEKEILSKIDNVSK